MKFNTEKHHPRSIRLKGYDYARQGGYFITVVTQSRRCLFGEIVDGETRLSGSGRMVQQVWDDLPNHYPGIERDAFVVMPNHVHGVIVLVGAGPSACPPIGQIGQPPGVAPTMSLPDLVHRFKTLTANRYMHGVKNPVGLRSLADYGNVTITNTSSAIRRNSIAFVITLAITRCNGKTIVKTLVIIFPKVVTPECFNRGSRVRLDSR